MKAPPSIAAFAALCALAIAGSTKYGTPIPVAATTTIKTIAAKDGMTDSAVPSAVYTIDANAPALTGTAKGGETLTADTASTYTPVAADAGKFIKGTVTRAGFTGNAASGAAGPVEAKAPAPTPSRRRTRATSPRPQPSP